MKSICAIALLLATAPLAAQSAVSRTPAAMSAIREADIKRDLYALAGDSMRGREAGTLDELRASVWLADEMHRIGLAPKGDMNSYYQWWNMRRTRISTPNSSVSVAGRPLVLWSDVAPTTNTVADVSAPTVFLENPLDTTVNVRGSIAVARLVAPPAALVRTTTNTPEHNYTRAALGQMATALTRRGAAAIVIVADSTADFAFDAVVKNQMRGVYDVIGGVPRFVRALATPAPAPITPVPVLLVHRAALAGWRAAGQMVDIKLRSESFESPSVNIIGEIRGTDPKLRDEYVVFSSHQDHDGVRYTVNGDSIWNGADDNATTSVAILAIARAFKQQPGKRSALFIFHGAEERGLLGSRYHVAHPVVPLGNIAAVLNGDMIGRNNPDTAALLGSQPPHRNSSSLVQMALDANRATGRFVIDSLWDRPTHPEGWYFRSDHVPYAERGVPSLFFSTNLHNDYHTPRDEPSRIDYPKLTRMTQWMYMTGWMAANAATKPATDAGFVLR